MRNVFFLSLTALAAATTVYAGDYKVTVPLGAEDEGAMAYLSIMTPVSISTAYWSKTPPQSSAGVWMALYLRASS